MKLQHRLLLSALLVSSTSCGATHGNLAAQFSKEYRCEGQHVHLLRFDETTMIAKGCAQYQKACTESDGCSWVKKTN